MLFRRLKTKKIHPRGLSSILYFVLAILCICVAVLSALLLIIKGEKRDIEILIPIFIIIELFWLCCAYLLYSSIRITIKIEFGEMKVKGQPIIYKNRIQHSFHLNIEEIIRIRIGYDEYNSKGEKFSSLNPRHMYQRFIYFEMKDDKVYKIWIKHFSRKQIDKLFKKIDSYNRILYL
ncbi:MAG: hypothetical protein SPI52_07195 [Bacilli bacterium]|nr:hypothetical protein [Bacilli bacterium]